MSNIQQYQQAFAVDFPVEIADQILGHMQALYGDLFDKKYGEIDSEHLKITVCQVLNGLSPADLQRGIQRMSTEKWCPTLPELRSWCIHDSDWWTAEQAWAKALNFIADDSQAITTLAKRSLDEVQHVLKTEGQKAAHRAFVDIYNDYQSRAKKLGRVQVMWVKPKAIAAPQELNEKGTLLPSELAGMRDQIFRRAGRVA